ncbi:MAG: NTPase [Candidatus Aenigmatarchaeota archaeon]
MRKFIVSGYPGSGKTTLALKVVNTLKGKIKITGIITPEIREGKNRIGFKVVDVYSNSEKVFASTSIKSNLKISKYFVDIKVFEDIALPALNREADFYIIDEIGKMEMFSEKFKEKIFDILNKKEFLVTVHRELANIYKNFGEFYWLTKENRDLIFNKIISNF